MKNNNHGWGIAEIILILAIIAVALSFLFRDGVSAAENTPFTAGIIKVVVPNVYNLSIEEEEIEEVGEPEPYIYTETVLTKKMGVNYGVSGKETYYNLPMNHCVYYMRELGYNYDYWIRSDGVKMYGDYVMIAADTRHRPKGTILPTSLGMGMVCDHCEASETCYGQIDIAVIW